MTTVILPPTPKGWQPQHTHTGRCDAPPPAPGPAWRDCRTCWAQGRIYHQVTRLAVTWRTCPTCLGTGSEWR